MARPKASELTERELEIMHAFWEAGESTIADVQQRLEADGRELAYTTVATLVRILVDKNFLRQTSERRPHTFAAVRSFLRGVWPPFERSDAPCLRRFSRGSRYASHGRQDANQFRTKTPARTHHQTGI